MNNEEVIKFANDTMQDLFDSMKPKEVNGHIIGGGFTVEPEPGAVYITFAFEFQPNDYMYDGEYRFGYSEMCSFYYLNSKDGRIYFRTSMRNAISSRLVSMIEAIIGMDKQYPILPAVNWDSLLKEDES